MGTAAKVLATTVLLATCCVPARADSDCRAIFLGGMRPSLTLPSMETRTTFLCDEAYAALASGVSRGALWSAERLTRDSVLAARALPRAGRFHPDKRLPPRDRAELSDYMGSGWDRGHMTPSGDAPTASAQEGTFSLANMVPQSAELNRERWEVIEETVRALAERDGELYVVTGPSFESSDLTYIGPGRILVPTSTWKAVADPALRQTGAWTCTNDRKPACQVMSIQELSRTSRIDPFPALPDVYKTTAMDLPLPGRGRYSREN